MAKLLMNLHLDLCTLLQVVKKFKCEFRKSLVQLFGANYEIKKVHISHALISLGKIVAMQYSCTYVQIISYDLVAFGFFVVALNPFLWSPN